jgi:hypothetical protein
MKMKKCKKILSGILTAALALSAMGTGVMADQTISGEGTVIAAKEIYDVILPTNFSYAVDPSGYMKDVADTAINVSGSAVYSGSFGVVNHSSVPLQIDVTITAEASTSTGDSVAIVTDAAVVTANNANGDSADIASKQAVSTKPLLSLEVAPLTSGSSVSANAVAVSSAGVTATYASVSFDSTSVVTDAGYSLTTTQSLEFALSSAAYEVSADGIALKTTDGGFYVSGEANTIEKVYAKDKTAYVDDPVVGFTIIGEANKYADWSKVTELPDITATFVLTAMTDLQYDCIEFNPTQDKVVSGGSVSASALDAGKINGVDISGTSTSTATNAAPSTTVTTATYSKASGATIAINAGSGDLAATDVASVKFGTVSGTYSSTLSGATYDSKTGVLTLPSGNFAKATIGDSRYLEITMNDSTNTTIHVTITIAN